MSSHHTASKNKRIYITQRTEYRSPPLIKMCASKLSDEIWEIIIIKYLTPRPIGTLECTCKAMKTAIKNNKIWEHQAVLAWNGFYRTWEQRDYISDVIQFIPKSCSEYRMEADIFLATFIEGDDSWCDWDAILDEMEVIGGGHKTLGYATTDPKIVIHNELKRDEYWDSDDDGERDWVNELKKTILEEFASEDYESSYDSDTSWKSFSSGDDIDGERDWQ
jgi:hypothetical protein